MQSVALFLLVAVAAAAAAPDGGFPGFPRKRSLERRDSAANIDHYMDRVLNQTKIFLVENNQEPFALTDKYVVNFAFKDLLGINWKTRLGLFNGDASNLTTIHRSGDAQLTYTSDARTLYLSAPVAFDILVIDYQYAAQALNLGPSGKFIATVKNLNAILDVAVNLRTLNATLQNFSIQSAKSIIVDVKGLTLLGNLAAEAFVNTFTLILKGPILKVVEKQVTSALEAAVNSTTLTLDTSTTS